MGVMKNLLITIHNGGDEAVSAVQRMGDDWRAMLEQASKEVETLRGDLEVMRLQRDAARIAIHSLAEQDATLSVCDGNVTVTMDATLTDAEREAIAYYVGTGGPDAIDATLRGLLDRLSPIAKGDNDRPEAIASNYPDQDNAPKQDTTPAQGSVPPEWMARPFWVDPPAGHLYGFPKLYDPATDGDMTAWMVANGYPQHLADKGLACTFTATY